MGNALFVAIAALVIASVVSAGDPPASASRGLAIKVLAHNIAPLPNFMTVTPSTPCVSTTAASNTLLVTPRKPACVAQMTDVIDHARAAEGVKKLVLPSNWLRLSTIQQLFVITDIERVDRGFTPYIGMNASLNAVARTAAIQHLDPYPPQSFRIGRSAPGVEGFGSVWAVGPNVLAVDYAWLYSDGWGGTKAARSEEHTSELQSLRHLV